MTAPYGRSLATGALLALSLLAGCRQEAPASADTSTPVTAPAAQRQAAPLSVEVFNPGQSAIFAVSSELVSGARDAVLIDAQFSATDAERLVEKIKASGKRLTTIYISHGDPDFYFGLATVHAAFPDAQIVATPQTVAHIEATKDDKLKVWGLQLGAGAPKQLLVPAPWQGDVLTLEGHELKIIGLDGASPGRTAVWVPSIRAVMGGVLVDAGQHVFMADTQTAQSHQDWLAALQRIGELRPERVIPGHYAEGAAQDMAAVEFTASYIRAFDEEAAKAADSAQLIQAMHERFPGLEGADSLALSAKVAMGEMEWK